MTSGNTSTDTGQGDALAVPARSDSRPAEAAVAPAAAKPHQPVIGYNHNARHNGQLFHLQTEDSGTRYARIVTQLFMDGGRIVKSVKTSYAEHLSDPNLQEIVREMMRQQHKAMFIALRDGTFDAAIKRPASGTSAAVGDDARATRLEEIPGDDEETRRTILDPDLDPPTVRQVPDELSLDLDALERAVQASRVAHPAFRPPSDLPPPPENLLRPRTAVGLFRAPREEAPATEPAPPPTTAGKDRASERRYAVARPAAIFGESSLTFGKAGGASPLHDDRSLDDIILEYLSDHGD